MIQTEKIPVQPPKGIPLKLIGEYLNNCSKALSSLREALDRTDYGKTGVLGHRLRGTGGAYGIPGLSDIGSLIEQASLQKDTAELHNQVGELEDYLSRIEIIAE